MTRSERSKWLKTIKWLRRNFKPVLPVVVETRRLKDDDGKTYQYIGDNVIHIVIGEIDCWSCKIDALKHEWAHAATWLGAQRDKEHSAEWGLAYAKIYDLFEEWNYGRGNA